MEYMDSSLSNKLLREQPTRRDASSLPALCGSGTRHQASVERWLSQQVHRTLAIEASRSFSNQHTTPGVEKIARRAVPTHAHHPIPIRDGPHAVMAAANSHFVRGEVTRPGLSEDGKMPGPTCRPSAQM